MKKSIFSILTLVMSACLLTTSCEDMLTPDLDRYASENKYGADSVYSAMGILRSIQKVSERTILLDACRSDLVSAGTYTTDSIGDIINFNNPADGSSVLLNVADFYHVVNSCNFYLANVDTTITENAEKTMLREWAEVQAMRAWAYMQLVRFYGEVPFVTTPVGSTDQADAAQKNAPKVNATNLASLLIENGLSRAIEIQTVKGLPNYETLSNGSVSFESKRNFFYPQLVLADAYLMNNDYANAAKYYYDFFKLGDVQTPGFNNDLYYAGETNDHLTNVRYITSGSYIDAFSKDGVDKVDVITAAVGAANASYGTVLQQLQHVFGFKTRTSSGTSVEANEQYQQVVPSSQYVTLNQAQRYNVYKQEGEVGIIEEAIGGDGRLVASAPQLSFMNGNKSRIIDKYAPYGQNHRDDERIMYNKFSMNYFIPFYRLPVVVLRYAEAVNRLGFPQLAFGILKDGLASQMLPTVGQLDIVKETEVKINIVETDTTYTDTVPGVVVGKIVNDGMSAKVDFTVDSAIVVYGDKLAGQFIPAVKHDSIPGIILSDIPQEVQDSWLGIDYMLEPLAASGGMYYMTLDERKAMADHPYLDFSTSQWNYSNYQDATPKLGIHARGTGDCAGKNDTVYTYARQVAEKIAEDKARAEGLSYAAQMDYAKSLYSGDTLLVTDKALIQNAVENIIVDEIALESAFEGNRFSDLVRIAEHKNTLGLDGTAWLAWKIARRNQNYKDDASQVDAGLQSKLLNKQNWYFSMPK